MYINGMGIRARPTGLLRGEQGRPQASQTGCQDVAVRAGAQERGLGTRYELGSRLGLKGKPELHQELG